METNVTDECPQRVRTRFEIAAARIAENLVAQGHLSVTPNEMQLAREFLELAGWKVQDLEGVRYRVVNRFGREQELTREGAFMVALRRLAGQE